MSGIQNLVVRYILMQFLRDKKKVVVGIGIMHITCIFELLICGVHLSSACFLQICLSVPRWVKSHEWKRLHYCLECWWRVRCCSCSQGRLDWGESCKYLGLSHLCNFAQELFFPQKIANWMVTVFVVVASCYPFQGLHSLWRSLKV